MSKDSVKKENIFIGVAWPYANGLQHIGHIAGAYLPPDIFARFHRLKKNNVLMVSGSDTHGTPVTVKAEEEKVSPFEVATRYHEKFIETYRGLGLCFDLFTMTHTKNHFDTVHEMFLDHYKKGYIYKDVSKQLYDLEAKMFLPDRYVEGQCPYCKVQGARGDQCDVCGKTYDAIDLINPVSKVSGSSNLEIRETTHFYLDLAKLNDALLDWIEHTDTSHWRGQVINFTKSELEKKNLRGRAITRDLSWGVDIPVEGFEDKRIYVWYEAVIGYLSAAKQYSHLIGNDELWKNWLDKDADSKSYYFIGKDNIVFHTIIWPAMIIGNSSLKLPFDVPANEYLNSYGKKFSKSRGTAIYAIDMLQEFQPDAIRYALNSMAPETSDVDFTWKDFLDRVNNELVANWGNLVNRIMGFCFKKFDAKIPEPSEFDDVDKELLNSIREGFSEVERLYSLVKLKSCSDYIRSLCQKVNQYLNDKAPWTLIKTDTKAAATAVYVALQCIKWLDIMWAPIIPFASQKIWNMLGEKGSLFGSQYEETIEEKDHSYKVLRYDGSSAVGEWKLDELVPLTPLGTIEAPFVKLDADTVLKKEEE